MLERLKAAQNLHKMNIRKQELTEIGKDNDTVYCIYTCINNSAVVDCSGIYCTYIYNAQLYS